MDKTQKQILKDIANSLDKSTITSWDRGDLEDWTTYARRMKNVIKTTTPILQTISNSIDEPQAPQEILSVDDIEHLRYIYDRMHEFYGENPNMDYMIRMDKILKKLE